MKKKIIGCALVSFVLISLAIVLPIIFLVKPDNQAGPENPTVNNTQSYTTSYNPSYTTSYLDSTFIPCTTTQSLLVIPTPEPHSKKPWWHWW